jgi:hypothetical protein
MNLPSAQSRGSATVTHRLGALTIKPAEQVNEVCQGTYSALGLRTAVGMVITCRRSDARDEAGNGEWVGELLRSVLKLETPDGAIPKGREAGAGSSKVKTYAKRVGLDPALSAGHSMRFGFLTSAAPRSSR